MLLDVTNPITDWFFPRRCLVCDRDIFREDLCVLCSSLCFPTNNSLHLCKQSYPALFYFDGAIQTIIKRAKFNRDGLSIYLLLKLIKQQIIKSNLSTQIADFSPTIITFIPSFWFNPLIRGVELPRLFALLLGKEESVPVVQTLNRVMSVRQTHAKTRTERLKQIVGAFAAKNPALSYERVLLLDDVVTTGATFDEAKKVLAKQCAELLCLAMAKTP